MDKRSPIGFFDSGLGGISVLLAARAALPLENCLYYGDSASAPYGLRPPGEILRLTRSGADSLLRRGVKALVVACNTATACALPALQGELPIPVIGIHPALEAAQAFLKGGSILTLATPATLSSPAYAHLRARFSDHVIDLPAPGLMEFVERDELSGPRLHAFLRELLAPCLARRIDVIALGCTHYPFLRPAIAEFFPGIPQIDDSPRVCDALRQALSGRGLLNPGPGPGSLELLSSGGEAALRRMRQLAEEGSGQRGTAGDGRIFWGIS